MLPCPFCVCGVVLSKATWPVSLPSALPSTHGSLPGVNTVCSVPRKHYLLFDHPLGRKTGASLGGSHSSYQGNLTSVLLATQDLPGDQPREQSGPDLRCYAFPCDISDVTAGPWFHVKARNLSVQETCCRAPFAIQPSSELKMSFLRSLVPLSF